LKTKIGIYHWTGKCEERSWGLGVGVQMFKSSRVQGSKFKVEIWIWDLGFGFGTWFLKHETLPSSSEKIIPLRHFN
jgi:hypothetical protein